MLIFDVFFLITFIYYVHYTCTQLYRSGIIIGWCYLSSYLVHCHLRQFQNWANPEIHGKVFFSLHLFITFYSIAAILEPRAHSVISQLWVMSFHTAHLWIFNLLFHASSNLPLCMFYLVWHHKPYWSFPWLR